MKGTFYIGTKYQWDDEKNILDEYLNVKWEGDKDTLCISTFVYYSLIVNCVISWVNQKNTFIAQTNTTISEYMALSKIIAKVIFWLWQLLQDINCPQVDRTIIYSRFSQSVITLSANSKFQCKSKIIDIIVS